MLNMNMNIIKLLIISAKQMLKDFFNVSKKAQAEKMDVQNISKQKSVPWVQKYRPHKLDDLIHQEQVTNSLKSVVRTGNLPHLLFYGPAGTGKTSAIIAMARQLFGQNFYKKRILELNASDERGINVIRQKVKNFATNICQKNPDKNFISPNFKIIILDEADQLTKDAQSALRRIIQDNSTNTRFCIICNYITKIIQPLSSRCVKFRFKPIPFEAQQIKIQQILKTENIKLTQQQISVIIQKGDLRQSINTLQGLHKIQTIPDNLLPIKPTLFGIIMDEIKNASHIKEVITLTQNILYEGYAVDELLNGLKTEVLKMEGERKKAVILQQISSCEQGFLCGAIDLTLIDIFTTIYVVFKNNRLND